MTVNTRRGIVSKNIHIIASFITSDTSKLTEIRFCELFYHHVTSSGTNQPNHDFINTASLYAYINSIGKLGSLQVIEQKIDKLLVCL